MASHRDPKGAYIRDTRDWFSQSLCNVGAADNDTTSQFPWSIFSLYNDDSLGRSLYVLTIRAYFNGQFYVIYDFAQGVQGTVVKYGQPISPMQGALAGQLQLVHTNNTNGNALNPTMGTGAWLIPNGFGDNPTLYDGILAIIPPTWCLRISSDFGGTNNSVFIQYAVLAQQ